MPTGRMNREQFYSQLAALDEQRLKKALWNLYWRGSAPTRPAGHQGTLALTHWHRVHPTIKTSHPAQTCCGLGADRHRHNGLVGGTVAPSSEGLQELSCLGDHPEGPTVAIRLDARIVRSHDRDCCSAGGLEHLACQHTAGDLELSGCGVIPAIDACAVVDGMYRDTVLGLARERAIPLNDNEMNGGTPLRAS